MNRPPCREASDHEPNFKTNWRYRVCQKLDQEEEFEMVGKPEINHLGEVNYRTNYWLVMGCDDFEPWGYLHYWHERMEDE